MNQSENPYRAPQGTDLTDSANRMRIIEQLDVAESWKKRFRLIEKAGGEKLPRIKELSFGERMSVGFNVWTMLFGVIYLLIKGMWKLALSYVAAAVLLSLAVSALEASGWKTGNALFFGLAAGFAAITNRHYYKKMVLGRSDWL
ncbi:DUF2628 domain-containing protein [Neisseria shayeganii]|uniref:DUF2628 domain-containing protein n=1 Tax=Neisseria shayeganii TaxID=607712 RepID=A0A7D7S682_9NEIS|nr:DUF2628 domain-containing protein [Neisseria shayeganii]QMT41426.1 DUF2628 domain-containing protein [Neisseria shayeganii]